MPTLLVKNADLIVTMDGQDRELKDAAIFCRDGLSNKSAARLICRKRGRSAGSEPSYRSPGLINTHHHFYQTLTRALPAAQDANLLTG